MTPLLDPAIYGCADGTSYTYNRGTAHKTLTRLKGRSRKILTDVWAALAFGVTITMDDTQFASWQKFWAGPAGKGSKPFRMRLRLDLLEVYESGNEIYEVNARTPWSATYSPAGLWDVTLDLTTNGIRPAFEIPCDVIYGGPITNLSPDSIYGGPIDNLAPDNIAPCEQVQP